MMHIDCYGEYRIEEDVIFSYLCNDRHIYEHMHVFVHCIVSDAVIKIRISLKRKPHRLTWDKFLTLFPIGVVMESLNS